MKKICIVLDSNVYISAFLFGGHPRTILEKIISAQIGGAISAPILDEVREVLQRPKFGLTDATVMALISELQELCTVIMPTKTVRAIADDPDDNRILECALAADADVIVSGDAHLLDLGQWRGIAIQSPAAFVAELSRS